MLKSDLHEKAFNVLGHRSILKGSFTKQEIEELTCLMSTQSFVKEEVLCREGEPADKAMILLEGIVHVAINAQHVAVLREGDVFGESAFSEDATRKASAIAKSHGTMLVFTINLFEKLISSNPNLAWKCQDFFNKLYSRNKNSNEKFFYKDPTKYIALIAHNEKKADLIKFVKQQKPVIEKYPLVATGTTGSLIFDQVGITLSRKVSSGPLGGDQVIGSMIAVDNILAVIFFRDPLSSHAHHADIEALGRLCDVYQVPFATNPSTAEAVLMFIEKKRSVTLSSLEAGLMQ